MTTQEQARLKILAEYKNDGERILDPGKFEGEPVFAPYFWDLGLSGFADNDNGRVFSFRFNADDEDFKAWPELRKWLGRKRSLKMFECSQGFVYCR